EQLDILDDISSFAPVIINVQNDECVYQRVLLVYGRAGPRDLAYHSNITVEHHADNFPSTTWPIFNSHFKCLVHLDPGPNNIRFTFDPDSFSPGMSPLSTVITVNYIQMLQNPPLHLAILVAKDSKCVIDAPPEKVKSEDNNLNAVKAKFRCAAYLWQAFTAEQMHRNGFERRVFRLEEEWQQDTLSNQDSSLRQTAKIHIIRTKFTLKELLDPERAQQYKPPPGTPPTTKKDLYSIFLDALQEYGAPFDKKCYVAGLILDSHWDPKMKLIRGHAALGGGSGHIQLGIFGSHTTHAWPKFLEEVVDCFQNETQTDEKILANDANESGTWWRCCNIGIVGHALTCPHSASGIMMRGYNFLNRTFTVKEPNNTDPITPVVESGAHWHRCDTIRFRYHPCFRIPYDPPRSISHKDVSPDFWPLEDNSFLICCYSGISLVEIH
ncbi:8210_t:CDS:2, partial [Scutellospora calospora]